MSRSLVEPSQERKITANRFQIKDTRQKPLAFRWWQPNCIYPPDDACADTRNCYSGCTEEMEAVLLENDWQQPTDASGLEKYAFRLHADGSLEFKGHLDASGGAVSGTVAVTLPGANAGEVDFLLANDQYFLTLITTDDGSSFTAAQVFIEAATGEVSITWPIS